MNIPSIRADALAICLSALVVVAVTVLAALHVPVPDILPTVATFALGIGGGAAIPRNAVTSPAKPAAPAKAPAAVPAIEAVP